MTRIGSLLFASLVVTTCDAFVSNRQSAPPKKATFLKYQFNPDHSTEIDRPLRRLTPDCRWVKETDEYRAVECAEGEQCSLEELQSLIDALEESKEKKPLEDDVSNANGRDNLLRILKLQHELQNLQSKLSDNEFVDNIKRHEDEEWEGHWFEDYLHHDEPQQQHHATSYHHHR